ncbi:hypothetical protein PCASD_26403 [Puccinia coronata f. sp. avenae]|uniref:Uncharacterized protein n=1 Tax=Puccinia coronata f. sp. avenae TaxID=200324 RepID=A0A2N5TKP6_9BASI|nr:hypothetical protein PCASD_26403 [Puccinia coronata f. sp. avenae]
MKGKQEPTVLIPTPSPIQSIEQQNDQQMTGIPPSSSEIYNVVGPKIFVQWNA